MRSSRHIAVKVLARLAIYGALLCATTGVVAWNLGSDAIARRDREAAQAPGDLPVEAVTLAAEGRPALAAWVVESRAGCGVVLVLHGRGADKSAMLGRARLFLAAGHSVALVDLSGHGGSEGETRGFGYTEGEDAARAIAYLRQRFPGQRLGAVGVSLGAAALALADPAQAADAYVFEQLFSTLEATTALRAPLPFARQAQATVLLAQMPARLGYRAEDVRPVERIGRLAAPKLLLSGTRDPFVGRDQAQALLAAAGPGTGLEWFEIDGHVDLERRAPEQYRETVLPFLSRHLCRPAR